VLYEVWHCLQRGMPLRLHRQQLPQRFINHLAAAVCADDISKLHFAGRYKILAGARAVLCVSTCVYCCSNAHLLLLV
jgi:hypothetical protein